MTHPLEEASSQIKPFIQSFKYLIKRTIVSLKHSASHYKDFHEELSELYSIDIEDGLKSDWNDQHQKIQQWALSKSKETIWNSEQIHNCFKSLESACIYMFQKWNNLAETLDDIERTPIGSPSKSRLKQRLSHESDQIEKQILYDIKSTHEMYLSIKKLLIDAHCTHFRLNMSRCKLQIQECPPLKKGMILSDLEYSEIDFSSNPLAHITLQNCLLSRCHFSKNPQDNVILKNTEYLECTGSLAMKSSDLTIRVKECQLLELNTSNCALDLNLEDTRLESMYISDLCKITNLMITRAEGGLLAIKSPLGGPIQLSSSKWKTVIMSPHNEKSDLYSLSIKESSVETIDLNSCQLADISSHDSSFIINTNNTNIKSISLVQTRYQLNCVDSRISTLKCLDSVAKIIRNNTPIENQSWSHSTVFQLHKSTSEKQDEICSVEHGKMECHRLASKQKCIIIHSNEHLHTRGSIEPNHQTIGRLLSILDIQPISSSNQTHCYDITQFQFEQILFLLKNNIRLSNSYLSAAITSSRTAKSYATLQAFNDGLTQVLQATIAERVSESPSFVTNVIDDMDLTCVMYFLGLLNLSHQSPTTNPGSTISGVEMDAIVYHHTIKSLTLLSPFSSSIKRLLNQLNHTDSAIMQINLLVTKRIPMLLSKTCSKQDLFFHSLTHLVSLGAWYLKIKTKAEILSSSLLQLLAEENSLSEPFAQTMKDLLTNQNPLIGVQKLLISRDFQKQIQAHQSNPFLNPIETHLASHSLSELSLNTLSSGYCMLVLSTLSEILRSYRPLFPWHVTGRRKRDTIHFLIEQFDNDETSPKHLLSKLYRYIEFLLGGNASSDSIQHLQNSLNLNQGRTRKRSGYLMTLKIAKHVLKNAICERSFHFPTQKQYTAATEFFNEQQSPAEQAKHMVSEFATTHIDNTIAFISEAISDGELSSRSQLSIERASQLNLNDQLKLSLSLAKRLPHIRNWSDRELNAFMTLWLHQQKRQQGYASKIQSIHLVRGLCFLRFKENKYSSVSSKTPGLSDRKEIELTVV